MYSSFVFEENRKSSAVFGDMLALHRRLLGLNTGLHNCVSPLNCPSANQKGPFVSAVALDIGLVLYQTGKLSFPPKKKGKINTKLAVSYCNQHFSRDGSRKDCVSLENELLEDEHVFPLLTFERAPKGDSGVYLIRDHLLLIHQYKKSTCVVECFASYLNPQFHTDDRPIIERLMPEGEYTNKLLKELFC